MVKKVFAIIGIVLGSVAAFVGSVVGIMAAMGKFTTPVVYPTQLSFLNNDQVVIERRAFDTEKDWSEQVGMVDIYSLQLEGLNPSESHEVNQKDCYVWFDNNTGADLITLCNKSGEPLKKDDKNFYLIKCNEPIYYMINKIDDYSTLKDGKVMLKARSTNERCETTTPFTLWIDRQVQQVLIDTENSSVVANSQPIKAGVGIDLAFKYDVKTEYSLKPISKESAKEIELFYLAKGYSTDYLKVTQETIKDANSPLSTMFRYDEEEGVLIFNAPRAGTYTFYLGAFKTYEAKQTYLAAIEGATLENPNYHQVNFKINNENAMAITTVTIEATNIEIGNIDISNGGFGLNLYSNNDYVSLNGVSNVPNAQDNNLGLIMTKIVGSEATESDVWLRYEEAEFGSVEFANSQDITEFPEFTSTDNEEYVAKCDSNGKVLINESIECEVVMSNISIVGKDGKLYQIVDHVYYDPDQTVEDDGIKLYCSNGMAAYNEEIGYKLIITGTYLNFYKELKNQSEVTYTQTTSEDFDFEAIKTEQTNSWQIISKTIPKLGEDERLVLGVLVVNSFGESRTEKLFANVAVVVDEIPLHYTIKEANPTLDVTFGEDLNGDGEYTIEREIQHTEYSEISYDKIVEISNGVSYTVGLLFTKQLPSSKHCIDVIDYIKFTKAGETYVLVGYIDEETGEFVNSVRINQHLNSLNNSCDLIFVQLKNDYDKQDINKILTKDIIAEESQENPEYEESTALYIMNNKVRICEIRDIVGDDNGEQSIKVNGRYVVNEKLLTFDLINEQQISGAPCYYERSTGAACITSKHDNMLKSVIDFYYGVMEVYQPSNRIKVDKNNFIFDANNLIVPFDTLDHINSAEIEWGLEFADTIILLPKFQILSSSPEQIAFRYEGHEIYLKSSEDAINDSLDQYIKLEICFNPDGSSYKKYSLVDGNKIYPIKGDYIFNSSISDNGDYFQDAEWKGQPHEVTYRSLDENIFVMRGSELNFVQFPENGRDYVCLSVQIGNTVQYIKVVIAGGEKLEVIAPSTSKVILTEQNKQGYTYDYTLSEDVFKLIYRENENSEPITIKENQYIRDVKLLYYGGGNLHNDEELIFKDDEGNEILVICIENDEVIFRKTNLNVEMVISFNIKTYKGLTPIQLTLSSDVYININSAWSDKTLYEDTSIQLIGGNYSLFHSSLKDASLITFDTNPTFSIDDNIMTVGSATNNLSITAKYNGDIIHTFEGFEVKPNVIAQLKSGPLTAGEDHSYSVLDIYDLWKFKSDVTFGSAKEYLYKTADDKFPTDDNSLMTKYTDDGISDFSIDYSNAGNSSAKLNWDRTERKLYISEITEINGVVQRKLTLKKNGNTITTDIVKIVSAYKATVQTNEPFSVLKEYNITDLVDFRNDSYTLSKIEAQGNIEFRLNSDKTKFNIVALKTKSEKIWVKLTFESIADSSKTLTLTENVKITSFAPTSKIDPDASFWTGEAFNVNDVYEMSGTIEGVYYEIAFTGVSKTVDGAPEDLYTTNPNVDGEIEFKGIASEEQTVYLIYTIKMMGDVDYEYEYRESIKIKNPQVLTIKYPESGLTTNANIVFVAGNEQYADILEATKIEDYYSVKIDNYEPILITSSKGYTLDFSKDSIKNMSRANVQTLTDFRGEKSYGDSVKVSLIAYSISSQLFVNYYTKQISGKTIINGSVVSLPACTSGAYGFLVFKLESESGYTKFYYVRLSCSTIISSDISIENNLKVYLNNSKNSFFSDESNENNVVTIDVAESYTYSNLINYIINPSNKDYFYDVFNIYYKESATSFYLYNISSKGVEPEDIGTKIDLSTTRIPQDDKFNTITIGLLYTQTTSQYVFGTITIYTQPTTIKVDDSLKMKENSNGEFRETVEASDNSKDFPVAADSNQTLTATILSFKAQSDIYEIKDNKIVLKSNNTKIIELDSIKSEISLCGKVPEDLYFTIAYKLTDNDGIVTYFTVDYKYKKTELTRQDLIDENIITLGVFDETAGFDASIDVDDEETELLEGFTHKKFFYGSYGGDVTFKVEYKEHSYEGKLDENCVGKVDENKNVFVYDKDEKKFTFTQGYTDRIIKITFTYTEYADTNNTRTYTFVISKAVAFDVDETGLGTSKNNELASTPSGSYTTNVGSTIDVYFEKKVNADNNYYQYKIGGRLIYTKEKADLEYSFNGNHNYVVKDGNVLTEQNKTITHFDSQTEQTEQTEQISFVHSVSKKSITITITVGGLVKTDLFVGVIPTYIRLDSKYLFKETREGATTQEWATHENVVSGDSGQMNLQDKIFDGNRVKLMVWDSDSSEEKVIEGATLSAMGFTDSANPNYIEFDIDTNFATIENNTTLKFKPVNNNKQVDLVMRNKTGGNYEQIGKYTFQIMTGDVADKLIEKTQKADDEHEFYNLGLYGTKDSDKYVSFVVANKVGEIDNDKLYILGELFDTINNVFALEVDYMPQDKIEKLEPFEYDNNGKTENLYKDYVQFKFNVDDDNINCILTIDLDTKYVDLRLSGTISTSTLTRFKITLVGANGFGCPIVEDFIINLFPTNFESKTEESGVPEYIYAGTQYEIKEILYGKPDISGYEFELVKDINKSYFQSEDNQSKSDITKLCSIDKLSGKYFLTVEDTGKTINRVVATFSVHKDGYLVDEFTYEFAVELNLQFVVNGAEFSQNNTSTVGETNYHLNPSADVDGDVDEDGDGHVDGKFPITINLEMSETVGTDNIKEGNDHSLHYNVLNYALYWRRDGSLANENMVRINKVSITNENDEDVETVEFVPNTNENKYQLVFTKDFNGTIILELSFNAKEGLGTYYYQWIIYVRGIAEITKDANSTLTERRLTSNNDPFKSLDPITPIIQTTNNTDSTIFKFTQDTMFGAHDYDVEYKYSYKIFNSDIPSNVTNEDLYNNTNNAYKLIASKEAVSASANNGTKLPAVPLTMVTSGDSAKRYFVVYKLQVSYLNPDLNSDEDSNSDKDSNSDEDSNLNLDEDSKLNEFVYYFSYVVINEGKIDIHNNTIDQKQSGEVDVDNGLTKDSANNDKYLELFSYKHYLNIKVEGEEDKFTHYELVYDGADGGNNQANDGQTYVKLRVGEYHASGDQENVASPIGWEELSQTYDIFETMVNGETVYQIKLNGNVEYLLEINDGVNLYKHNPGSKIGSMKTEGMYMYTSADQKINSMFNSTFDNIFAYQSFIKIFLNEDSENGTTGIKFSNSDGDKHPQLVNIPGTYRFGINLSEHFSGDTRFKNEYIADLIFVQEGAEIYTVPAFQNSVKTAGFKLTTGKKISPENSYKLTEIFKLDSYYAENSNIDKIKQYQVIGAIDNLSNIDIGEWFTTDDVTIVSSTEDSSTDNSSTDDSSTEKLVATIKIPSGANNYVVYEIYSFKAKASRRDGDLYTIEADYNYIKASKVIVPDYTAAGGGTFSYYLSKTAIIEGKPSVDLDLSKGFAVWEMGTKGFASYSLSDDDTISVAVKTQSVPVSVGTSQPSLVITSNWYENLYLRGKTLKISTDALKAYKSKNIDSSLYSETLYITIGEKTFECKLEYALDDKISINIKKGDCYQSDGQVKTIKEIISDKGLKYAETDTNSISNDIVSVSEIVETGGSSYITANSKLDIGKIQNYFDDDDTLNIKMEVSVKTDNGNRLLTLEFVIEKQDFSNS